MADKPKPPPITPQPTRPPETPKPKEPYVPITEKPLPDKTKRK